MRDHHRFLLQLLFLSHLATVLMLLTCGCGKEKSGEWSEKQKSGEWSEKQKEQAAETMKALGRVEAATQVGVNNDRFSELLGDAKLATSDAEAVLPNGEMKTNMVAAMSAYQDSGRIWNRKLQEGSTGLCEGDDEGGMIARYQLAKEANEIGRIRLDVAMKIMWQVGAEKLAAAKSAQPKE